MITGAIKNKVDKIWTDIWAGGITNPLTVIEQLTYLMFIRSLDEKELETEEFENMSGGLCAGANSKMTTRVTFMMSFPSGFSLLLKT